MSPPLIHPVRWNLLTLTAMVLLALSGDDARALNLDGAQAVPLKWATTLSKAPTREATPARTASSLPALLDAAQQAAVNRVADASVQAAQAQQQQAWASAWMPRVEANAVRSRQKTTQNGSTSQTPSSALSLNASLPLWRAADRANADAQAMLTKQSEWQARAQRASTAREVCFAYIAAAEATEQRRLAEAQLDLLQTQLHINERRLQAGLGTILDELETRTRLDQVRASVQDLSMRATSQQLALERLTSLAVQLPAGFNATTANLAHELPGLDEALALATERNPDFRDARAEVEAARSTSSARDAEFWQPTVDATASVEKARSTITSGDLSSSTRSTDRNVGVQLNWPLFTGGVQHGRVKEATALLTRSQARLDDVQSAVQTSLRDAYQNLTQAQAIIAAQQDVEATATATFEALRKAFAAGTRTNIDLLNAQQQIYSARQNLVAARVTALSAQINILALIDQLDADHVAPMTAHFDTAALPAAMSMPSHTPTQMPKTTR